jgi:WD40 repeat protein
MLVTADYEGSCAHAFDVRSGNYIRKFPKADKTKGLLGHTSGTWALAFSPDGEQLGSGGWDNKGVIWDAKKGKALYELRGHTGRVTGVAYSPHEDTTMRVVATAAFDGTVRTWEPETGDPLFTYAVPTAVAPLTGLNGIAFAPDGSSMTVAGDSGLATTFSVPPDRGHQGRLACELKPTRAKRDPTTGKKDDLSKVLAVAYSPDSRYVATAHSDGLVRLWDLALGVEVHIMKVRPISHM